MTSVKGEICHWGRVHTASKAQVMKCQKKKKIVGSCLHSEIWSFPQSPQALKSDPTREIYISQDSKALFQFSHQQVPSLEDLCRVQTWKVRLSGLSVFGKSKGEISHKTPWMTQLGSRILGPQGRGQHIHFLLSSGSVSACGGDSPNSLDSVPPTVTEGAINHDGGHATAQVVANSTREKQTDRIKTRTDRQATTNDCHCKNFLELRMQFP